MFQLDFINQRKLIEKAKKIDRIFSLKMCPFVLVQIDNVIYYIKSDTLGTESKVECKGNGNGVALFTQNQDPRF